MIETSTAPQGRPHWLRDALLGGIAALGAITLAHAARPEAAVRQAAPQTVERIILTAAPTPAQAAKPVLIAFSDPVPQRVIVSPFGLRRLPWEEGGRLHAGVDLQAQAGSPVIAAADGVVVEAGSGGGYGRYVAVRHAEGLTTVYAHLGRLEPTIAAGKALKAGEPLGRVGSSGTSTGPHLHFEIRDRRDRPLNPALFLGKAFAQADDLPLSKAQRFGRSVRIAEVSNIPASKRALMKARVERGAAANVSDAEVEAAVEASFGARDATAKERIDGLKELKFGADGRPRAQLAL